MEIKKSGNGLTNKLQQRGKLKFETLPARWNV
jgi:hypothetical protein